MNQDKAKSDRDAVNEAKAWLVRQGNDIGEKAGDTEQWTSQIRGLWEVARTENEPEVLLNHLRYQFVRNKKTWGESPEKVKVPLETALEQCVEKAGREPELAMAMIQHLLAYTYRAFTYHAKKNRKPKQSGAGS